MSTIFRGIFCLSFSTLMLFSPLSANSALNNPNGLNQKPEPGWSYWKPQSEIDKADFNAGFSNLELGGYLEFENACTQEAKDPKSQIQYWFRLSNAVNRIGTGKVEYGCWVNNSFLHTYTSTAIKKSLTNVNCLRVNTGTKTGLAIHAEPTVKAKRLRVIANGAKVKPGSYPAVVVETEGQNWLAIASPVDGWISDGSPTSQGNLRLCRR